MTELCFWLLTPWRGVPAGATSSDWPSLAEARGEEPVRELAAQVLVYLMRVFPEEVRRRGETMRLDE